jgi:hypothetical protein
MLLEAALLRTIIVDPVPPTVHLEPAMPKHVENAERLRTRAKECRALAQIVGTEQGRASYLRLAEAYEKLAEQEAALAALYPSRKARPDSDLPA